MSEKPDFSKNGSCEFDDSVLDSLTDEDMKRIEAVKSFFGFSYPRPMTEVPEDIDEAAREMMERLERFQNNATFHNESGTIIKVIDKYALKANDIRLTARHGIKQTEDKLDHIDASTPIYETSIMMKTHYSVLSAIAQRAVETEMGF